MKNLKSVLGLAAFAALAGTTLVAPNVMAWGDSSGNSNGRPTYTKEQINNGAIDDKIVLNSISDNETVGNELYFVQAREEKSTGGWITNEVSVEDGKTYIVRMYVHNNNRFGEKMVAKDVTARAVVPTETAKQLSVSGVISSSNATPNKVWDDVVFKSNSDFHLEYVAGSAHWDSKGASDGALSDDLLKAGVKLGYNSRNGELPGCFNYSGYVSFKVKAVYDVKYEFTIDKKVRLEGTKEWFDQIKVNDGDTVEYKITYKNTSKVSEKDVHIVELMGTNLQYVKGSTVLYNSNHKNGISTTSDDLVSKNGLNIGDYAAGATGIVVFKAKVVNNLTATFGCGTDNVLRNWAQGYIGTDNTMKQDYADVIVHPACPENPTPTPTPTPVTPTPTPVTPTVTPVNPEKLPETGAGSIVASVLGAGSVATSAGYYVSSRKKRF